MQLDSFDNKSELIDIAKGKYKLPITWREHLKARRWRS